MGYCPFKWCPHHSYYTNPSVGAACAIGHMRSPDCPGEAAFNDYARTHIAEAIDVCRTRDGARTFEGTSPYT